MSSFIEPLSNKIPETTVGDAAQSGEFDLNTEETQHGGAHL